MKANDPGWELLRRCRDGDAAPADFVQLEQRLATDPAFRRDYVRYLNVDAALATVALIDNPVEQDRVEQIPVEPIPVEPAVRPAQGNRLATRLAAAMRRPLAAALGGLIVGLFSASAAFAWLAPRPLEQAILLLHESFEDAAWQRVAGFPQQAEQWSGDQAVPVPAEGAIRPVHGERMLRMGPATDNLFSRMHYVLDLKKNPLPEGIRQVRLTASFRPASTDKKSRYLLRAASFSQELHEIEPRWMTDLWSELDERALARAARGFPLLPGTDGWQTVSITLDVPPGASMLVVSLWTATMEGHLENRNAHYLDDVRLSGIPQEPTP
ncbi:hypothetical protein [Lignipirellula cremea]|uniref:Uncharacterized protein n=1 Tax=Lignipirellula cremea TaxID=2528010 RepID=A0A518DZ66_9BACT|nr:hypothetical protein [Lignipirellula cremea]QDU97140.1 hypothetical protein Pla8534_49850 [Lignipirellula cremea]